MPLPPLYGGGTVRGGYDQAQEEADRQRAANMQNSVQGFGLLAHIQAQQQDMATRQALTQSGGDVEKALQIALQTGNLTAAHALAPLVESARKAKRDAANQSMMAGADKMTPDQLDILGQNLAAAGHPGAAAIMTTADRRRAQMQQQAALAGMKSEPVGLQAGQSVPGTNQVMQPGQNVPPEDMAAFLKVAQSPPGTTTAAPQPGDVSPVRSGGVADFLTSSPYVGSAAKALQQRIDRGGMGMTPTQIETQIGNLTRLHTSMEGAKAARDQNQQGKLVSVIGPDGKTPILVPASQAQGMTPTMPARPGTTSGVDPAASNLHGEPYISTLDPTAQQVVRGLVDYSMPLNAIPARSNQDRMNYFAHAKQADPNFDVKKYPIRQGVMKDFTSGTTSNNIVSIDQAINHMGTLKTLADALQNNDIKVVNTVVNAVRDQLGDPRVTNAEFARQAVATELMRVFRQVNADADEVKRFEDKLNATANSPAQMKGVLQTGVQLLNGRINALNRKWDNGMETHGGYPNILSPEAQSVWQTLTGASGNSGPTTSKTVDFGSLK